MTKLVVLSLLVLLLVPALFAHKKPHKEGKEHEEHDKEASTGPICHYRSTRGVDYDLRLLENNAVVDYQFFDAASKSTFYFRPCGAVKTSGCDQGSSVCMINSAGKAVNFGSGQPLWADGVENGASIEATYGQGELCNNGVPRKTVVEYVCNLQAPSSIMSGSFDDCSASFVIETPYACPVVDYCHSIDTSGICESQDGLCTWIGGKCEHKLGCAGWKRLSHSGVFVIILLTSAGVLLACTLCLCVCACRRRRRCRTSRTCRRFNKKAARKCNKVEKKRTNKGQEVEYAPFQMPFQLVPGGFAPINPYSNIQGYPLVTFVAPQPETEQEV